MTQIKSEKKNQAKKVTGQNSAKKKPETVAKGTVVMNPANKTMGKTTMPQPKKK